jgi:hypothetical protein
MSIFYIDLVNGNDSNDGTSWALAWKTITNGATIARIAPGDEIRIAKTSNPVSIGNATWNNCSKTVTLANARTINLFDCESGFTASNGAAVGTTTMRKQGSIASSITPPASTATGTKYAYKTITAVDLSGLTAISFWFQFAAVVATGNFKICLCSDTSGDTIVDTFPIPALPFYGVYIPLTLSRIGGGYLGSSIQSIAIYSDTVAPTGSKTILLDNIMACYSGGLSLQSLISKNGNAKDGLEGYYAIQSIVGTTVLLDNGPGTLANAGRGYSGVTEIVETFLREGFKTDQPQYSNSNINVVNNSGTESAFIKYTGGWNTSTNEQDGETFFDGLSGYGYGWVSSSKQYWSMDYINFYRYNYGVNVNNNRYLVNIKNIRAGNCSGYGIYLSGFCIKVDQVFNANNCTSNGIYILNASDGTFSVIREAHGNLLSNIIFYNAYSNTIKYAKCYNSARAGFEFILSNNNTVVSAVTQYNITASIIFDFVGNNAFLNPSLSESNTVSTNGQGSDASLTILNDDSVEDNNWMYFYLGTANWQTLVVHESDPGAWLVSPVTGRSLSYPIKIKIAEVAVNASSQVTVTTWAKMADSSGGVKLIINDHSHLGITETYDTKSADTDWEQLSIQFTPTQKGVVDVYAYFWNAINLYLGSISISQA